MVVPYSTLLIGSGQAWAGLKHLVPKAVALAEKQQILPVQFVRRDPLPLPPEMSGRNDNAERLRIDRLRHQPGFGKRQGDDDNVQFASLKRRNQAGGKILLEEQGHLRCLLLQRTEKES